MSYATGSTTKVASRLGQVHDRTLAVVELVVPQGEAGQRLRYNGMEATFGGDVDLDAARASTAVLRLRADLIQSGDYLPDKQAVVTSFDALNTACASTGEPLK